VLVRPGSVPILRITARLPEADPYREPEEPDLIELAVESDSGESEVLGTCDGRYLSSEVAGGFTGRVLGIEALTGSILVTRVSYSTGQPADD
jgi:hypothetical protein